MRLHCRILGCQLFGLYTEYAMCYLNYNILKLRLYFEIMTGKLTMDVME